jgi:DNA-binding CsgD family transcriptional regulator/PAS domain-containing protein
MMRQLASGSRNCYLRPANRQPPADQFRGHARPGYAPSPAVILLRGVMQDEKRLSALIGDVYDATLNPSAWTDVLGKAAQFVGGSAATLFSKSATSKTGGVVYESGTDPHYKKLYFEQYIKLDPSTTGQFFADIEEPIATADLIPYDEFLATRFYREWVRPQGLVDFVTAVLDKSVTSAAMFGVFRHERDGVVDAQARQRMRLIVPHIRRAVLIGRLIDLKAAEAARFTDLFEGLNVGMFLVDGHGRIVHANAAGHVMMNARKVLRTVGGRLVAATPQVDQTLREIFAAAASGDAAVGVKGIATPLTSHPSEPYVAHVLPLTSGERRRTGATYTAAAAIFVRKASVEVPSPPEIIAKTYELTPTELRVLLAIVEVGGVPEVATALGVAETTVKTHLGRLFEKTGAGRQAELVKLVAGFSSPLLNR